MATGDGYTFPVDIDYTSAKSATKDFYAFLDAGSKDVLSRASTAGTPEASAAAGEELVRLRRQFIDLGRDIERAFNIDLKLDTTALRPLNEILSKIQASDPRPFYGARIGTGVDARKLDPNTGLPIGADTRRTVSQAGLLKGVQLRDLVGGVLGQLATEAAAGRVSVGQLPPTAPVGPDDDANTKLAKQRAVLERRLRVATIALGESTDTLEVEEDIVKLNARVLAQEQRRKAAVQKELALLAASNPSATAGPLGAAAGRPPGLFQRVYGASQGLDPSQFGTVPTLRRTLTRAAVTSASYGLSGGLLYGGISQIKRITEEAENLERIFNQIERQFESLGQPQNFAAYRAGILGIAAETGAAADEVANVAFQFQGAFGGNTAVALERTAEAFRAVRVTGLGITEVIDAFTALTENFDDAAVSIEQISDKAIGLQERFGVLAKETISFAADLAPVAAQIGFTVEELEALGAVAQKYSGRSGASLAEAFGRIFPQIQENGVQFSQLFSQLPGFEDQVGAIDEAFRTGNIRDFFEILLQGYQEIGPAQQNYILQMLGGRRETAALVGVLENADELLKEFDQTFNDVGKTSQYFGDLQETLSQRVARFGEQVKQLGVKIFDAGLGDFLKNIIDIGSEAIGVLEGIGTALAFVGDAVSSIPGLGGNLDNILQVLAAYGALRGVSRLVGNRGVLGFGGQGAGIGGAFLGTAAAQRLGGFGSRVSSGFTAARTQSLVSAGALGNAAGSTATAAQAARAGVSGVAGGIRSAFTGFGWASLGLTVGLFAADAIGQSIQKGAQERLAQVVGSDLVASNQREANAAEQAAGFQPGFVSDLFDRYTGDDFNGLRDYARDQAEQGQGGFQDFLSDSDSVPFLPSFSENAEAAKAQIDAAFEFFRAETTSMYEEISANQQLLQDTLQLEAERQFAEAQEILADPEAFRAEQLGLGNTTANIDALIARAETDLGLGVDGLLQRENSRFVQFGIDLSAGTAGVYQINRFRGLFDPGGQVEQAQAKADAAARAAAEVAVEQALTIMDADEARTAFESGDINLGTYRAQLESAINTMRKQGYDVSLDPNQRRALAEKIQEFQDTESTALINQAEALIQSQDLISGGDPQFTVDTYVALLESGNLSPEDQTAATQSALTALQAVHQARIDATDSAAEQAALLASGIPVPEALRVELIQQYLETANLAFQDFLSAALAGNTEMIAGVTELTARIYADGGVTLNEAGRRALEAQLFILNLQKQQAETDAIMAFFSGLYELANNVAVDAINDQIALVEAALGQPLPDFGSAPTFSSVGANPQEAAQRRQQAADEARQEAIARQNALFAVQSAEANGDPVRLAQIAQQRALYAQQTAENESDRLEAVAAYIEATQQLEEAFAGIRTAQRDLLVAQSNDDPIVAAQAAVEEAQDALSRASGAEAQARAAADLIRAQSGQQDAIQALADAESDIIIAMAERVGDTVGAAKEALAQVQRQLARTDLNPTERRQLEAEQIRLTTAVGDAQLSEQQELINFQLEMGQITRQQAIAGLQGLLQLADSDEEVRNLLSAINSLKDQLGEDFQFNLPTQLGLPTVYEVRRLGQTGQTGGGYNDNRQINVTVVAQTNADPAAIAAAVGDVVGQPNRFGSAPRRY